MSKKVFSGTNQVEVEIIISKDSFADYGLIANTVAMHHGIVHEYSIDDNGVKTLKCVTNDLVYKMLKDYSRGFSSEERMIERIEEDKRVLIFTA